MSDNIGLYRGKLKDIDKWVYWNIYGELVSENGKIKNYTITKGAKTSYYYHIYKLKQFIIPETVGQYTGLTGKNKKKIFEGDIVQNTKTKVTAVVQWFPEYSAFMLWYNYVNEVGFLYESNKSFIEIIGNIHDKPL